MKLKIFCVYDDKAEAFLPPFFLPKEGMALRAFADCANDPKHQFGANPGDYTLFELGEFDDQNGTFDIRLTMKNHGAALLYQKHENHGIDVQEYIPADVEVTKSNGKELVK